MKYLRNALVALGLLLFSSPAFALCGTGAGTCFWVGGGSSTNWSATANTNWAITSGGSNNAGPPVAGDAIVFDTNSGTGTSTISTSTSIATLVATGYTGTLVQSAGVTLTVTGNTFTLATGMTYSFTGTGRVVAFTATSGTTALTSAGKTLPGILVNGVGGTVQLQDNLAFGFSTNGDSITLTNGTFDANGFNVTGGALASNNTNTRVLSMGTGTWSLSSGGGTVFDVTGSGLTVNAGSATLNFTASTLTTNRAVNLGTSHSYGTIGITSPTTNPWSTNLSAVTGVTIGTLNIPAPNQVLFNASITYTISNAVNWAGTSSNPLLLLSGPSFTPTLSLTAGGTLSWAMIGGIAFAGTAATTSNSLALPGNSGITVNVPSGGGGGGGHIIGG